MGDGVPEEIWLHHVLPAVRRRDFILVRVCKGWRAFCLGRRRAADSAFQLSADPIPLAYAWPDITPRYRGFWGEAHLEWLVADRAWGALLWVVDTQGGVVRPNQAAAVLACPELSDEAGGAAAIRMLAGASRDEPWEVPARLSAQCTMNALVDGVLTAKGLDLRAVQRTFRASVLAKDPGAAWILAARERRAENEAPRRDN